MNLICKGITLSGNPCHRKIKNQEYCYQHRYADLTCNSQLSSSLSNYRQTKPSECIICYESLANQRRALSCGHWVHTSCVINSAKAECPICRSNLTLGTRAMKRIEKLAKKREAEYLEEEEQELQMDLQQQVAGLIAPALQERIHVVVGNLLDETEDISATDVLNDIFDDDTYQSFLSSLIGYGLIEIQESMDTDSEEEFD